MIKVNMSRLKRFKMMQQPNCLNLDNLKNEQNELKVFLFINIRKSYFG